MVVGSDTDPNTFIWCFAWWPHALLHWENPIYTHAIWAPTGFNLVWATSIPGLALAFAPLTLLAGPVVAFNTAAILMPALAAWTAFLLCRYLTHAIWPSLVGGYLFGFSSYMLGHQEGHMNLTAVFLVPLVALVVLRYLDGELSRRALALQLGILLAAQLSLSTEVFAKRVGADGVPRRPDAGDRRAVLLATAEGARWALSARLVRGRGRCCFRKRAAHIRPPNLPIALVAGRPFPGVQQRVHRAVDALRRACGCGGCRILGHLERGATVATSSAAGTRGEVPAFFTNGDYKRCLAPGENVLVIPYGYLGNSLLWQALSGFRFRIAGGEVGDQIPAPFTGGLAGTTVIRLLHDHILQGDGGSVLALAREKGVSTILVDQSDPWPWSSILAGIGRPESVGGVLLYSVGRTLTTPDTCGSATSHA